MNRAMEDRLRAAYQAKAEQVTDERLTQLRAEREEQLTTSLSDDADVTRLDSTVLHPWFGAPGRTARHSRWFAPALAAAVVVAVAAGALAIANSHGPRQARPAPPATHLSSPTGSPVPTPTAARSTSASQPSVTATNAAPPYLARGKTGSRTDIPWSAIGAGWQLVQPMFQDDKPDTLYLYDPAGGRYLVSDQVPGSANLVAWSPDGQRAMFQSADNGITRFRELDLQSGQLSVGFTQYQGYFVSYTQPRGLAVLVAGQVQGAPRLLRYGTDGSLQLAYPAEFIGGGPLTNTALYSSDGSQFVAYTGRSELVSNGGQLIRQYPLPQPDDRLCQPLRWWTSDSFLEACDTPTTQTWPNTLYVQPVAGGAPTRLTPQRPGSSPDYDYAWQLSNGDVLLQRAAGCGVYHYDILRQDSTVVPLRMPAGVPDPTRIVSVNGDLATFTVLKGGSCGGGAAEDALVNYNMVTGTISTLMHGYGNVVGYPGND
jgi:hypothetical protein